MLSILTTIAIIAAVLVAAVLVYASTRPATFRTERSITIRATPERIFPLIADPKTMNTWNPFNEDPSIKGTYSGPERGPGARYTFVSRRAGTGYTEVADEQPPRSIGMRLVMTKPFACNNRVEFTLEPLGPETRVTWSMSGSSPFMAKVMGLFMDCDKMCGDMFVKGLSKLKSMVEGGPTAVPLKVA